MATVLRGAIVSLALAVGVLLTASPASAAEGGEKSERFDRHRGVDTWYWGVGVYANVAFPVGDDVHPPDSSVEQFKIGGAGGFSFPLEFIDLIQVSPQLHFAAWAINKEYFDVFEGVDQIQGTAVKIGGSIKITPVRFHDFKPIVGFGLNYVEIGVFGYQGAGEAVCSGGSCSNTSETIHVFNYKGVGIEPIVGIRYDILWSVWDKPNNILAIVVQGSYSFNFWKSEKREMDSGRIEEGSDGFRYEDLPEPEDLDLNYWWVTAGVELFF